MSIGWNFQMPCPDYHEKQVEFVHIHQTHHSFADMKDRSEREVELVSNAQLNVANSIRKEIANNHNYFILSENIAEDITVNSISNTQIYKIVKEAFPKGLSHSFQDLNFTQKKILCEYCSPTVLLCLGEIKSIYKAAHKKIATELSERIKTNRLDRKFTMEQRENDLIECIKEVVNLHINRLKKLIFLVVYGGGHNFKSYCEKEGYTYREENVINSAISFIAVSLPDQPERSGLVEEQEYSSYPLSQHSQPTKTSYGTFSNPPEESKSPTEILDSIKKEYDSFKSRKSRTLYQLETNQRTNPMNTPFFEPLESKTSGLIRDRENMNFADLKSIPLSTSPSTSESLSLPSPSQQQAKKPTPSKNSCCQLL
jgi:hypothetical protein